MDQDNIKKQDFEFLIYNSLLKESIIDLLKHLWTDRDYNKRKVLFEWKYESNPYIKNLIFVAVYNNEVVGFRGYTINPTIVSRSKNFYTACLADAVTNPLYRGKGVFKKLTQYSIERLSEDERIKVVIALSSNKFSTPGYLKLGWKVLAENNPLFRISILGIFRYILRIENKFLLKELQKENLHIKFTKDLDFDLKNLEELAYKNIDANKFSTIRDKTWYQWRLLNPTKDYYYCTCWKNEQLLGFILLNQSKKYWSVVDYLYTDNKVLDMLLTRTLKELKPQLLMFWTVSKSEKFLKILKRKGFFSLKFILNKLNKNLEPVLVRNVKLDHNNLDWEINNLKINQISSWNLNLFDSDAS